MEFAITISWSGDLGWDEIRNYLNNLGVWIHLSDVVTKWDWSSYLIALYNVRRYKAFETHES